MKLVPWFLKSANEELIKENKALIKENKELKKKIEELESRALINPRKVTDEQVKLLLASIKPNQKLYIMLDRDADKQASQLADKLYPKHNNTYLVINPTGRDANDLGHEKTWEIIHNHSAIASPENISLLFL